MKVRKKFHTKLILRYNNNNKNKIMQSFPLSLQYKSPHSSLLSSPPHTIQNLQTIKTEPEQSLSLIYKYLL